MGNNTLLYKLRGSIGCEQLVTMYEQVREQIEKGIKNIVIDFSKMELTDVGDSYSQLKYTLSLIDYMVRKNKGVMICVSIKNETIKHIIDLVNLDESRGLMQFQKVLIKDSLFEALDYIEE